MKKVSSTLPHGFHSEGCVEKIKGIVELAEELFYNHVELVKSFLLLGG